MSTCSGDTLPVPLRRRQMRPHRPQRLPGHAHPLRGSASAARTRRAASAGGDPQHPRQQQGQVRLAQLPGEVSPTGRKPYRLMIDQRQPVPEPLEPEEEPDQAGAVELVQRSVLDQLQQMLEATR